MHSKKAFTLIELLVVIAIIAILAAILFPVFAQAKLAAKKAVSISNLKQLALAEKMYENDYDDTIVLAQVCPAEADFKDLATWQDLTYPYVKAGNHTADPTYGLGNGSPNRNIASGLWADPAAPDNQSFPYGIHSFLSPDEWGYSCNGGALKNPPTGFGAPQSATSPDNPAGTGLLFLKGRTSGSLGDANGAAGGDGWGWVYINPQEYAWVGGYDGGTMSPVNGRPGPGEVDDPQGTTPPGGDCDSPASATPSWDDCGEYPRYRYSNQTNVGFVDGHAKSIAKQGGFWGKYIWTNGMGIW